MLCYDQFVAKEGDTVEPGTRIAIISKSAEVASHVAPSEKPSEKAHPSPPIDEKKVEPSKAKVESPAMETKVEKPKPKTAASPPPPKRSATEPQLPPKERERRVSLLSCIVMGFKAC